MAVQVARYRLMDLERRRFGAKASPANAFLGNNLLNELKHLRKTSEHHVPTKRQVLWRIKFNFQHKPHKAGSFTLPCHDSLQRNWVPNPPWHQKNKEKLQKHNETQLTMRPWCPWPVLCYQAPGTGIAWPEHNWRSSRRWWRSICSTAKLRLEKSQGIFFLVLWLGSVL